MECETGTPGLGLMPIAYTPRLSDCRHSCCTCGCADISGMSSCHDSNCGRPRPTFIDVPPFMPADDLAVSTKTADSIARRRSFRPGSGLPCCAHSFSVCMVAKHSSHLGIALAVPVKLMANSEEFTTDHVCSLSMWPVKGMPRYTRPTPGGGSPG